MKYKQVLKEIVMEILQESIDGDRFVNAAKQNDTQAMQKLIKPLTYNEMDEIEAYIFRKYGQLA